MVFPEFIVKLLGDFKVLDIKFHIAGVSIGGLSAFRGPPSPTERSQPGSRPRTARSIT
jgi:hypothetical protein